MTCVWQGLGGGMVVLVGLWLGLNVGLGLGLSYDVG